MFCTQNLKQAAKQLLICGNPVNVFAPRFLSIQKLTNSLTFVSQERKNFKSSNSEGFKFALDEPASAKTGILLPNGPNDGRLCILIGWLTHNQKHLLKYGKFYLDQDFDLLLVRCSPWQLCWPVRGKVIANDILTFMENNPHYSTLFIHAFSVGFYVWGLLLTQFHKNPGRYSFIHDRLVGQIWDSIVQIEGFQNVGFVLFPDNLLLQKFIQKCVKFHLHVFYNYTMKYYLEAKPIIHNSVLRSPALIFSSESDPVALHDVVEDLVHNWRRLGIETRLKTWKKSSHVNHMRENPVEYKMEMKTFLDKVGLLRYPQKFIIGKSDTAHSFNAHHTFTNTNEVPKR